MSANFTRYSVGFGSELLISYDHKGKGVVLEPRSGAKDPTGTSSYVHTVELNMSDIIQVIRVIADDGSKHGAETLMQAFRDDASKLLKPTSDIKQCLTKLLALAFEMEVQPSSASPKTTGE